MPGARAYREVVPKKPKMYLREILKHPVSAWKNMLVNDFEDTVLSKYRTLRAIKEKLYELGAFYASMSGSGSSVYGLFDQPQDVGKDFPQMQVWSGLLPQ